MALGIDDLYDDEIEVTNVTNLVDEPSVPPVTNDEQDEFIVDYLKSKGIQDLNKIKFEDDNRNIVEKSWNELSKDEKFNILNTPLDIPETEENTLTDDEIKFINEIRENNLTPQQYIDKIRGEQSVVEPQYKIDDLSDDELYLIDFESRVGELSDEQATQVLALAKQNEELYKKQVDGIRKEYKEREDYQSEQEKIELEQQQQEAYQQYQDSVIDAINSFNSVGNLDLNFNDDDKNNLARFMLSQDEQGSNYLYRALQEPETLVKAAWFILNGDEAFDSIQDYFTNQIKLVSESQYKKGFEDGRKGSKPTIVIDNSKNNNLRNNFKTYKSIDELDDED